MNRDEIEKLSDVLGRQEIGDLLAMHDELVVLRRERQAARRPFLNQELAVLGFCRIGRVDDAGRRSLWLREERDAIEMRAGREGCDASVRVEGHHPLYRELSDVMSCARFAAEWEDPSGGALEVEFVLDEHPRSIHRRVDETTETTETIEATGIHPEDPDLI